MSMAKYEGTLESLRRFKDDVPEGALAVSENAQRNIDGYAAEKAAKMREEQNP